MAKVLVTGATGFIGSNLTRRLVEQGDDVTCLVRNSSKTESLEALGVRFVHGDVRDRASVSAAVSRSEVVYHLAGLAAAFRTDDLMQVNATALRNVVESCAACPTPPTLISVSSLAAAGPSAAEQPRTEADPARPVSRYGRAKRAGELVAEEYADRVPITILRPPIVFGEGDLQMRNIFRTIDRFGVHIAFGVANRRYSLIHVDDLVDALVMSAARGARLCNRNASHGSASNDNATPCARGYYFAACEEQPTFAELGRLIGHSLGRARTRVMRTGPILLWHAAAMAEVVARLRRRPYIFNFDKAREAWAGHWICSTSAIQNELGFKPRASLAERLAQTSEWYRRQNLL